MAFASNSGPLTCRTIREDCLWIEEGKRAICVTYKYDVHTGAIKYAASVFRRRILDTSEVRIEWDEEGYDYEMPRDGVPYIEHNGIFYRDLDGVDVENHHDTTTRRYQIRPAKVMGEPYMSYDDLIKTIRWEMCHGAGCRGPRKARKSKNGRSESPESQCSDVSSVSDFRVSEETHDIKTVFRARYFVEGREIFIAFKGRPSTGEILYGATIHRPDPDYSSNLIGHDGVCFERARLTPEEIEAHFQTAEERLAKCPVHYQIPPEMRSFRKQLKRSAKHREDLTIMIVDNVFDRRGGHFQIRGDRVDPELTYSSPCPSNA